MRVLRVSQNSACLRQKRYEREKKRKAFKLQRAPWALYGPKYTKTVQMSGF